jgi:6-pyruvoyltetrahydropterin/6-carboxytetrahydropterin synthase
MHGLGRHYELTVRCRGEIDPKTGYLIDIKVIDREVRGTVIPLIAAACHTRSTSEPAAILPDLFHALAASLAKLGPASLDALTWNLTPTYGVAMEAGHTGTVLMRQRFDFAAAHRLHAPALSDEENRRAFGKCNNPSGHGHNYQFEPVVAIKLGETGTGNFSLADLEALAQRVLIEPFDHKHLNVDTPEFTSPKGSIPSVENIARVFFERLAPAVQRAHTGATLRAITVWETDRTSCTYPG